jgi:cell division initiation protein
MTMMTNSFGNATTLSTQKEVKTMNIRDVSFSKQFNGYDRDEVDRYIKNLSQTYQTAYEEYNAVCTKYNELFEKYKALGEQQDKNKPNADIITKTLVNAESLAQKIIAEAQSEADIIKAETQTAAQKIKDEAYVEKASAKIQAQKLIDDANTEASAAQEQAQKILSESQTEAARIEFRAKQNLEQANGSILQIIGKLQDLVAPKILDVQAVQKQDIPVLIPLNTAYTGE